MNHISFVYEPNRHLRAGPFSLFRKMVSDLLRSRELGYRLFLRDFSASHRQSILGVLWVFVLPVFSAGIFIAMNRAGVLRTGETGVPYPVFVFYGITVWSLFTGLTSSLSGIVGACGGLITRINIPRIALVFSPVLVSLIDFGIRFLLLGIVMTWGRVFPGFGALLFPMALLPLAAFSIGIGLALSIVGALVKDLANFVNVVLTAMMFVTPVVYLMPPQGFMARLTVYNPLYYLIDTPRTLLFYGTAGHVTGFAVSTGIALFVFLMGWRFYHLAMGRIVEKA